MIDEATRRRSGRSKPASPVLSPLLVDLARVLARQSAREALAAEHTSPRLNMETNDDVED